MGVKNRACDGSEDFIAISEFLYSLYQPNNRDGCWLQPIWEYAYTHPLFDEKSVSRIGIWEDGGTIVGVTQYELSLGEAFLQIHPDYANLKPEMLLYAEEHLRRTNEQREPYLKVFVDEFDTSFEEVMRSTGYKKLLEERRPMAQMVIPDSFPPFRLPKGFRLKSLADDNDIVKFDRVLWRGFNHPGEPPDDGPECRIKMQSGPHYRKDLAVVVEAPNRDFVSFAGLWLDHVNKIGYVEPVATDPDFRCMGLGTAVVMEGVRRCRALGATVVYVGSDMSFYLSMGFRVISTQNCWTKLLSID